MSPEQELKMYLIKHPEMQGYHNVIQSALLKCNSQEERLNILLYFIQDNLVELQIELDTLIKKIDKV